MSCTSCHDPHRSPAPDERVAFYRAKCLTCHGEAFGAKHHTEQPDCTSCHMQRTASADIAHTQVTDHRIPRKPGVGAKLLQNAADAQTAPQLVPFPGSSAAEKDTRDLAIAWGSLAANGVQAAEPEARRLLTAAAKQWPDDAVVLASLAFVEQREGAQQRARELYERALALDPHITYANVNLGVLEASHGELKKAVVLWQRAFKDAPARSDVGLDLARVFCQSGQFDDARSYTLRVLQFNPDFRAAKKLLRGLNADKPRCEL